MKNSERAHQSRREFLAFLAGSPLLASVGILSYSSLGYAQTRRGRRGAAAMPPAVEQVGTMIGSAAEAINVFDFHAVARATLPPAHYGYLATGVDDDATLKANLVAFTKYYLRPRRLVDVRRIDMSVQLFGETWESPIILAPVGSQKAFDPEGDVAVARAAKEMGHLQILSTVATSSVEEVAEARGGPIWYQLYATGRWEIAKSMLRRAEAAGCPAVVLTVDLPAPGNRETRDRYIKIDSRDCTACHPKAGWQAGRLINKPMYDGLNLIGPGKSTTLTWDLVQRLRDETSMKVLLKGIVTREDAALCVANGVEGIIVSNHGGRAEESGRSTLDSLPEVLEAVGGRIPVLVDGGFRRGMDIFKALALGASAVCIGRPYLWGLASFGQPGVEKVLELLRAELAMAMRFAGTPSIREINKDRLGLH